METALSVNCHFLPLVEQVAVQPCENRPMNQITNRLCLLVMTTAALLLASGTFKSTSTAGELHFYEHNLSVISWFVAGDNIKATYETPRPGLLEAGVVSGTILFEGRYEAGKIVGTAFAFKRGCSPAPYQVVGTDTNRGIELRGPGPIYEQGCRIKGYSLSSPHSLLAFRYSSTHH